MVALVGWPGSSISNQTTQVALDVNDAVEVCTTRGWELAHVQSIQAANDSIAVAFEDGRSAVPKAEKTADSWKGSTGGRWSVFVRVRV